MDSSSCVLLAEYDFRFLVDFLVFTYLGFIVIIIIYLFGAWMTHSHFVGPQLR